MKSGQITLRRLGLKGDSREEEEALMDSLDAEGSGRVRYGDFASFFTDTAVLSKTDSDLTERYWYATVYAACDRKGRCIP